MKKLKIAVISLVTLIILIIGVSIIFNNKSSAPTSPKIVIDPASVLTDRNSIQSEISALKNTISVIEEPGQENLRDFNLLPYYFARPNTLVVKDKAKFMKDLGYVVTNNILSLHYPEYLTSKKPTFSVIPISDFAAKYRELQVKRFQEAKLGQQRQITYNDTVIADARNSLTNDPTQLGTMEKQVAIVKKQLTENVAEYDRIIRDFSDPSSVIYNKSEVITGAFVPPSTILFREPIHSDKNAALDNLDELVRTMVHESLHYYANAESKIYLSPFFYEGFTEYLTLKSLDRANDEMYLASGYPLHTQVMVLLAKKIPFSTLEKINFTQNGALFGSVFKEYFPSTNFDSFIQLTSDIDTFWYSNPAKHNSEYKDYVYIIKAKNLLEK